MSRRDISPMRSLGGSQCEPPRLSRWRPSPASDFQACDLPDPALRRGQAFQASSFLSVSPLPISSMATHVGRRLHQVFMP
jgi:hypothetical protein